MGGGGGETLPEVRLVAHANQNGAGRDRGVGASGRGVVAETSSLDVGVTENVLDVGRKRLPARTTRVNHMQDDVLLGGEGKGKKEEKRTTAVALCLPCSTC